jgi:hypothetical protein
MLPEALDGGEIPTVVDAVQLHRDLIDPPEHVIRSRHQRVPLGALDVHLQEQSFPGVAVAEI